MNSPVSHSSKHLDKAQCCNYLFTAAVKIHPSWYDAETGHTSQLPANYILVPLAKRQKSSRRLGDVSQAAVHHCDAHTEFLHQQGDSQISVS